MIWNNWGRPVMMNSTKIQSKAIKLHMFCTILYIHTYLSYAHVYVCPSRYENINIVNFLQFFTSQEAGDRSTSTDVTYHLPRNGHPHTDNHFLMQSIFPVLDFFSRFLDSFKNSTVQITNTWYIGILPHPLIALTYSHLSSSTFLMSF